jgi:RNA polymerase sigma-70 factor (ECF subfamily)
VFGQRSEWDARAALIAFDPDRPAVEAARRDSRRFETLYRRYVAQVYSFALYETRDHHAAEDLTEQVFLSALAALPRFDERGDGDASTFRVWLFRIARNALANQRRGLRRHPVAPIELAAGVAATDDPAAAAVQRDELERAWTAIAALPEDRRRALLLRFVEEMSVGEIAQVMGRTDGAVRVLIHRALRSVSAALTPSPAGTAARVAPDTPTREVRRAALRPKEAVDAAPAGTPDNGPRERRRWWRR